jgi:hypothetical protein
MSLMNFPTSYSPNALFALGYSASLEVQYTRSPFRGTIRRDAGTGEIGGSQTAGRLANPDRNSSDVWDSQPQSNLGKRLKAIQQRALDAGLKLKSNTEILNELRQGRERGA